MRPPLRMALALLPRVTAIVTVVIAATAAPGMAIGAGIRSPQDDAFEQLKRYDFQKRAAVDAIQKRIRQSLADRDQTAQIEQRLIAVLEDSGATFAGKQEACQMLWVIGSARSVPTLARMLGDEKLADIARYALERNVDPLAGKALRSALPAARGKTLVGLINSIGDRHDGESAAALKPYITTADPLVTEASLTALGKIGSESALTILRTRPASDVTAGKAILRCAEHMAAAGKKAEAERLYESLTGEARPAVVRAEGLRALAQMGSTHTPAVVLATLKSPDPYLQQVAAQIGGSLPDPGLVAHWTAAWPNLPVFAQVALLSAMAERRESAAAPLALRALDSKEPLVRMTAIHAVALIGGEQGVARLVDLAVQGQGPDRSAARESLARMSGPRVEENLIARARQGDPAVRATLMAVLADRPTPGARAALMESARGTDARVALEALRALGRIGGAPEHAALLQVLVNTPNEDIRDTAKDALVAIGKRVGESSAEPIRTAFASAPAAARPALLGILAESGGEMALDELLKAAESTDSALKQAAVAALAEGWGDSRPLPKLLKIARSDSSKVLRVQAMRGYLRIVGLDDRIPAGTRVSRIEQALEIAERPEEKRQALSVLRECRVTQAVELASKLLEDPALVEEAADTLLYLAAPQKKGRDTRQPVKGPVVVAALDKVVRLAKNEGQRAQAQKLRQGGN